MFELRRLLDDKVFELNSRRWGLRNISAFSHLFDNVVIFTGGANDSKMNKLETLQCERRTTQNINENY